MSKLQNTVAVVFDYDSTITTDSTSELLESRGIDVDSFWEDVGKIVEEQEWDPTLAYLHKFIVGANEGDGKLAGLKNEDLRKFGAKIKFYPGVLEVFDDLKNIVRERTDDEGNEIKIKIEFYIISGGLEELIKGSAVAEKVETVRACQFATDPKTGVICGIKNSVSFTGKTRYLFEINKGVIKDGREKPFLVNAFKPAASRPVPFEHMIYLGDGLTDVPSFSIVTARGGTSFGVADPKQPGASTKAWERLAAPKRVVNVNEPDYRPDALLGAFLRRAVHEICTRIQEEA